MRLWTLPRRMMGYYHLMIEDAISRRYWIRVIEIVTVVLFFCSSCIKLRNMNATSSHGKTGAAGYPNGNVG